MILMKNKFIGLMAFLLIMLIGCGSSNNVDVDLDKLLSTIMDSLQEFEQNNTKEGDAAADDFLKQCERRLNDPARPFTSEYVALQYLSDGSFEGYLDKNQNSIKDSGENQIFKIEIDGEKPRVIATDTSGHVRDRGFSGSGLLTGMLIGHMLTRQRAAGVKPSSLSNKKASSKSAYQSARNRASSGSHRSGK